MDTHPQPHDTGERRRDPLTVTRRSFVFLGMLAFAGCAAKTTDVLPGPIWPDLDRLSAAPPPPAPPVTTPMTPAPSPASLDGVLARSQWAREAPVPSLMNPMLPVKYITVHHDGLAPFMASDESSSRARLELIRNGHRGKGWGDIGYHYLIDRNGRVWEGRPITWQGAHVKNWNEGNIGVCCLGNFDQQAPSAAQIEALERQLRVLMRTYNVPASRVKTHQEWADAKTACPGRSLQAQMVSLRKGSRLA